MEEKSGPVQYHVVYHWDRIIIAALVLLALIGGGAYGAFRLWGGTDPEPRARPLSEQIPATNSSVAADAADAAEQPDQPTRKIASTDAVQPSTPGAVSQTVTTSGTAPAAEPKQSDPAIALRQPVEAAPAEPAEPAEPAKVDTLPSPAHPRLGDFTVGSPSPAVSRARFAASIRDKEPEGEVGSIRANDRGMVRVYFFTEVKNRKGDRLTYRWTRDGKQVASVHAGAWNNDWRSYSSKFITPAQHGSWRVELVDSNGKTLAWGAFDYKR